MDARGALNRETATTTKATTDAKSSPRRRFLLSRFAVAIAASLSAACAGSVPLEEVQAPPSAFPPPFAPPSPPRALTAALAPQESAPAPAAPRASFDVAPRAPRPESRPGLGTEWGEARYSPTHDVPFTRADEERPLATTELRYDDERGVEALASYAESRGHRAHTWNAVGGAITIWLAGGDGNPLDVVEAGGHTFVIGEAGERYSIFLENHTGHRFEAVASVDGLDVIDGSPGALENRGYLLMPYGTLEIRRLPPVGGERGGFSVRTGQGLLRREDGGEPQRRGHRGRVLRRARGRLGRRRVRRGEAAGDGESVSGREFLKSKRLGKRRATSAPASPIRAT